MRSSTRRSGRGSARRSLRLAMVPHSPWRWAGTMGTPAREAMRSRPERKTSVWPLRVSLPSGKITTTSPALAASTAASIDASSARRLSSAATGMTPAARRKKPTTGIST